MRRITFAVSFELPLDCTIAHAKQVLIDHLQSMGGDLNPGYEEPGDPMFDLDRDTIIVRRLR